MAASPMNGDDEDMEVEQETENALDPSATQQPDTNPTPTSEEPASEEPANQKPTNQETANQKPSTSADNNKKSKKIVYPSPADIDKDIEKFVKANPELLKNFDGNFNSSKELIGLFNGIIVKYSPIYSKTDGDKCWLQSVCASIMFKALDKYEIMFERINKYVDNTLQTIEKKNQFYDKVITRICGTELVPSIKPNGVDSTKAENDQVKKPKRKTNKEKKEEYEEHVYANIMIQIHNKCQKSYDLLKLFTKYPAITHRNLELILTKSISPKAFIFSSLIVESLKIKEKVKDESKASDQEVKDECKANDKEIKEDGKAEENQDESKDSDQEIKENIKAEENQHEQISDIYDWVQSFYDAYVRLLFKISIKQYFDDSKESFKSGVKESNIKTFTEKFKAFYTEYAVKDEKTRESEAKADQHKNLKDLFWDDILTKVEPAYVTIFRAFCYADKSIRNIITDEKRFLQKMKELNTDCLESTRITYNSNNITVCDVHHTLMLMPIGAFGKLPFHCYAGIVYGCFPKIISETGPGMYVHNDIQSRVEYDFRELEKVESIVAEYECLREKLGKFAFIHDELVACKLHEETELTLLNATKLAIDFAGKIGKENLILYFKTSNTFSKDLEVVNIVINQVTKDGRYLIEVSNAKEDVRSFYPVFQCASGKEGMKESPTSSIEIGAFDLFIAEEVRRNLLKLQNAGIPATAN